MHVFLTRESKVIPVDSVQGAYLHARGQSDVLLSISDHWYLLMYGETGNGPEWEPVQVTPDLQNKFNQLVDN